MTPSPCHLTVCVSPLEQTPPPKLAWPGLAKARGRPCVMDSIVSYSKHTCYFWSWAPASSQVLAAWELQGRHRDSRGHKLLLHSAGLGTLLEPLRLALRHDSGGSGFVVIGFDFWRWRWRWLLAMVRVLRSEWQDPFPAPKSASCGLSAHQFSRQNLVQLDARLKSASQAV